MERHWGRERSLVSSIMKTRDTGSMRKPRLPGETRSCYNESMNVIAEIEQRVSGLRDEMVRLRRDFHRHPEPGFRENRTAGIIADYLRNLGMEVREGVGRTGVVGMLRGETPGRTLMLRADMDALPIQEKSLSPYRSTNPGVMHACGHDGHMAILLGAASILSGMKRRLRGQIKFVFQPAEEGAGGAKKMIEDGVLKNPGVDAAFGLHLITALPCGTLGWGKGTIMAAMDSFVLKITGRSGHSSMPETGIDAIRASARIIGDLHALNTANSESGASSLINIGTVRGGEASNVIAEEVELTGTVRTLNPEERASMQGCMRRLVARVADEFGAGFKLDYREGYPPVVNDAQMTDLLCRAAGDAPGVDGLLELPPLMASEDMAFYLREVPGCFFFLGAGNAEKGLTRPLHSSEFDFDESALAVGAMLFARLAASLPGME